MTASLLEPTEPMGIYQTLAAFAAASGLQMGDSGTHPWSQGFPLLSKLPEGPELPSLINITGADLGYPKPCGQPSMRKAIANYYRSFYGSKIDFENVMVFAGGRAALFAITFLLARDVSVMIEETEYALYFDLLKALGKRPILVPSNVENGFLPSSDDYRAVQPDGRTLRLRSNPCNPTGQVMHGDALQEYIRTCSTSNMGAILDEAYEFFVDPEPVSAMQYIEDIDSTNLFVVGAATKGLQAPGIRVGWVVASKQNIAILGNYSTFAMGGVSRVSQLYAEALLETERVRQARSAISRFYSEQRVHYGNAFADLGLELFTGQGGFYHWCKLPNGISADEFNKRLFREKAAITPGRHFDMRRAKGSLALENFFRFSFGPLDPKSFDSDVQILKNALASF